MGEASGQWISTVIQGTLLKEISPIYSNGNIMVQSRSLHFNWLWGFNRFKEPAHINQLNGPIISIDSRSSWRFNDFKCQVQPWFQEPIQHLAPPLSLATSTKQATVPDTAISTPPAPSLILINCCKDFTCGFTIIAVWLGKVIYILALVFSAYSFIHRKPIILIMVGEES